MILLKLCNFRRLFYILYKIVWIRKYYWNRTNMHKFIELFKYENSIVVKDVAKKVWKKGIMLFIHDIKL